MKCIAVVKYRDLCLVHSLASLSDHWLSCPFLLHDTDESYRGADAVIVLPQDQLVLEIINHFFSGT